MLNPYVYPDQAPVIDFCKAHGIAIEAYGALRWVAMYRRKLIKDSTDSFSDFQSNHTNVWWSPR